MKLKLVAIFTIIILTNQAGLVAQDLTTIILVRHAEKGFDEGGDPDLTEEGKFRAKELARVLQYTNIDAIYSTLFKRTKQTVEPLAEANGIDILEYNPFKLDEVERLINEHKGKTLVFSGHSNTTPVILNKLIGEDKYRQLEDTDYDNLYIVSYLDNETAKVTCLEYGKDSNP